MSNMSWQDMIQWYNADPDTNDIDKSQLKWLMLVLDTDIVSTTHSSALSFIMKGWSVFHPGLSQLKRIQECSSKPLRCGVKYTENKDSKWK